MIKEILPQEAAEFYQQVYDEAMSGGRDDALASKIAWTATRSRMTEVGGQLVCNSESFSVPRLFTFTFDIEPEREFIVMNSDTGELELDAVLATTEPRTPDGKYFTEVELEELAMQINEEGSTLPDVDHATLQSIVAKYGGDYDKIVAELKREKGIFKNIKAAVKNGKLWVRAQLDKRYKNYTEQFRGLSIEAIGHTTKQGRVTKPRYLGFTFTNTPRIPGAGVAY